MLLVVLVVASHFVQVEGQLEDYGPETVDPHQIQKSHLHPLLDQHLTVVRQVTQVTSILGHGFKQGRDVGCLGCMKPSRRSIWIRWGERMGVRGVWVYTG